MLYTNYEPKLPNEEKFREDGLPWGSRCQVLSEDRGKGKGEIVGTLKERITDKKDLKEVFLHRVQHNLLSLQESFRRVYVILFGGRGGEDVLT